MSYAPSVFRVNKYRKYLMYFFEYLNRNDVTSITDSLKYVFLKKLPTMDRLTQTEMGWFRLRANTTDFQFINWSYEREIKEYLKQNYKEIGLFIDIGACIGEYCVWLGNKGIQCIAIEPINHEAIRSNLTFNTIAEQNTWVFPVAVGKETERVAFHVLEGVTSSSCINKKGSGNIPCHKLDGLIDEREINREKMTFIKLDVEGMELDVLEGATSILSNISNLQIVYEHTSLGDRKIRSFLNKWGEFHYKDLDGVNTLAIKKQPI